MGLISKLIVIIVLIAVIAGAYYMFMGNDETTTTQTPGSVNTANSQSGEQAIQSDVVNNEDDVELGEVTS